MVRAPSGAERGLRVVRGLRIVILVVGCSVAIGCGDDTSAERARDAASERGSDAALEGGPDAASVRPLPPPPPFDGSFAELLDPSSCTLLVAAACDGNEDCTGGQLCCGTFDSASFTYRSIECSSSCEGDNQRVLCHPGDTCAAAGQVCRRSQLLPFDFISVCASPSMSSATVTGEELDDLIVCGEERCHAGSERCCLRGRAGSLATGARPLAPYCTPEAEACECPPEDAVPDASASDGAVDAASPTDDDAGDADGG